ncbi:hypothetical protein BG000_008968 [Podila horticola]|nr:hypothetical protein BG000_008968 [Podila horticola]
MSTSKQGSQQYQRPADVDIRPYLPWALEARAKEHVSYTNFVQEFELQDRAYSQLLYSNLTKASDIKLSRRKKLQKQYTSFSKHKLDDYWAARALELERNKTRAHSAVIAARTARLAQTASVYESSLGFHSYQGQHRDAARRDCNISETAVTEGDDNGSKSDGDIPADAVNMLDEAYASDANFPDGKFARRTFGLRRELQEDSKADEGSNSLLSQMTPLHAPLSPNENDRHRAAACSGRRLSNTLLASGTQPVSNPLYQTYDTPCPASSAKSASNDQAKRARSPMTSNPSKKRMRLRDPWHDLADTAVHLFNGKAVDLPPKATKDTEKDPERKKLYELAWRHLRDAKDAMGQENANKETCLHFRDAFVALSGVFNLYSLVARKALSSTDCLEAKRLCLMPELDYKDDKLTKLLDSLKTTKKRKLTEVLEDVYSWLSSKPTFRLFLLALRNIGEQGSCATRVSKTKLACALNIGCSARKCNCTLSIGTIQFGNGEAKRASTPPAAVKVQLRKNIKIARSVMLELSKFGLDCPPQLSLHGLQADVFRVLPWKGVYVAAPACDAIVLPTTEAAWNLFIEKTAHHLKTLLEYYHEYAVDAKEKMDIFNYTRSTIGQEEEGEGEEEKGKEVEQESDLEADLDDEIELIDWSDVIFHTPTKPRAAKTITGLRKPDNQRFRQKMQEAMTKFEYDGDNDDDEYDED